MLWLAITHQPHWQPVIGPAWPGKTEATETRGREWRNRSERKRNRRRERKLQKYPGKLLYNWHSLSEPYFMCMSRAGQPSRPHWNPTLTGAVPRPSHLPAEESRLLNTPLLTAGLLCVCAITPVFDLTWSFISRRMLLWNFRCLWGVFLEEFEEDLLVPTDWHHR